jgi:hypothetical protein
MPVPAREVFEQGKTAAGDTHYQRTFDEGSCQDRKNPVGKKI